ncbi:3-hydroxyasparagine phosphotransferase [Streptomyces griseorubiginosus]|uniref:3-hydroxyasparagine phosphotransferase n=1 Tax=Streptomyces griseorubiginosus TaxID=67304 RepID=UPI0033AD420E
MKRIETFETTVADQQLIDLVHEVCPGLEPTGVVHRSRTSLVVAGVLDGAEVIAKVRTPDWRRQCLREIEAYDLFDAERPPVRVPRRLAADAERAVLVTERLPGAAVHPERFPAPPLADRDLTGVLKAVRRLRTWHPEVPGTWRVDYQPLVDGILERRDLDERHEAVLVRMLELAGPPREFGHGDLVLANVVRTGRAYTLIDWASAAVFLPCLDLAQLWLLLGDVPGAREHVEAEVARLDDQDGPVPFLVNLTLLLYRERRAHARFTDEVSRARARRLDAAWEAVRERVMRYAG